MYFTFISNCETFQAHNSTDAQVWILRIIRTKHKVITILPIILLYNKEHIYEQKEKRKNEK